MSSQVCHGFSKACNCHKSEVKMYLFLLTGVNSIRSSLPEVSCKKSVLKHFVKITEKQLCQGFFFNKVAGKRLWNRCFPVNLAKFLRAPFLQNTSWRLLLAFAKSLPIKSYIEINCKNVKYELQSGNLLV